MRLWSLHPKYLDSKGLVACWREGLLAQAVLQNKTTGYKNHPALTRFKACKDPIKAIGCYLWWLSVNAELRGYNFDVSKIALPTGEVATMPVSIDQISFETEHLQEKLKTRKSDAEVFDLPGTDKAPTHTHPVFYTALNDAKLIHLERGIR